MSNITARSNTTQTGNTAQSDCPCDEGFFPETNSVCGTCRPENQIDATITGRHGSVHETARSDWRSTERRDKLQATWKAKQAENWRAKAAAAREKSKVPWARDLENEAAAKDRNLSAVECRVFAILAAHDDRTLLKGIKIRYKVIAKAIGMSIETAKRAVKKLVGLGYIEKKVHPPRYDPVRKRWWRSANNYWFTRRHYSTAQDDRKTKGVTDDPQEPHLLEPDISKSEFPQAKTTERSGAPPVERSEGFARRMFAEARQRLGRPPD